jgi:hypothetical protein
VLFSSGHLSRSVADNSHLLPPRRRPRETLPFEFPVGVAVRCPAPHSAPRGPNVLTRKRSKSSCAYGPMYHGRRRRRRRLHYLLSLCGPGRSLHLPSCIRAVNFSPFSVCRCASMQRTTRSRAAANVTSLCARCFQEKVPRELWKYVGKSETWAEADKCTDRRSIVLHLADGYPLCRLHSHYDRSELCDVIRLTGHRRW